MLSFCHSTIPKWLPSSALWKSIFHRCSLRLPFQKFASSPRQLLAAIASSWPLPVTWAAMEREACFTLPKIAPVIRPWKVIFHRFSLRLPFQKFASSPRQLSAAIASSWPLPATWEAMEREAIGTLFMLTCRCVAWLIVAYRCCSLVIVASRCLSLLIVAYRFFVVA